MYRTTAIFTTDTVYSSYILDILCTFNYNSEEFAALSKSTTKGINTLSIATLSPTRIKATLTAVHPITGSVCTASIDSELNAGINAVSNNGFNLVVLAPATNISAGSVGVTSNNIIYNVVAVASSASELSIKVKKPITCVYNGETLTIGINDNYTFSEEVVDEHDRIGLLRHINGLSPSDGDIKIAGVGGLSITINGVENG